MRTRKTVATAASLLAGGLGLIPGTLDQSLASTTKPAAIVLGSKSFFPRGEGWGTAAPTTIFNGGDPSGLVTHIHWQDWGAGTATGWGMTSIYKPSGGYYPELVPVELRASHVSRFRATGVWAYMLLQAKEPGAPGAKLGRWFVWATPTEMCN